MNKKRKMQEVQFRTVEELLDFLPDDQLAITDILRDLVLTTIPDVTEHLAYNVPYYKRFSNICFIWPGAVPWGKQTQPGVRFGFTKGYLLDDQMGYLDRGTRKQVFWRDFFTMDDINHDLLSLYLTMAVEIDQVSTRKKA